MRNLNKPNRYNVASIQAQQTLGGDVMQADDNGQYIEWRDYKWLLESYAFVQDQWKDLDAENARLKDEVERLTKLCQATSPDGFIHIRDINAAKEGKQS